MDIDFGKTEEEITNGKIKVAGYQDLEFDGYFKDNKTLKLESANDTTGPGGKASFYGSQANIVKGDIKLENDDIKELKGDFEADKNEYNDLDELTKDTYFINNTSTASYEGIVDTNNIFKSANISMDIDFGKDTNQITNGKVDAVIKPVLGLPLLTIETPTFTFNGDINSSNHATLTGTETTTGTGGADFYGKEANQMKGGINFSKESYDVQGSFEADKK